MQTETLESLADIEPDHWNALVRDHHPFLLHEFLHALEHHGCVGEDSGWLPHYVVCRHQGRLVGAVPLYLKTNSYGEFVFDWGWAEAYHRHGLRYYPKLVAAVPYTPATGQRLLLAPDAPEGVADALLEQALEEARRLNCSSLHWLFPPEQELDTLERQGLMHRLGCQFHWHNPGYRDFQDYLDSLVSKKRKNIRRERRQVQEAGLDLEVLTGRQISARQWRIFHQFYCDTFHRLGGYPTLTLPFFQAMGTLLDERVVLVLARQGDREVAAAISFASDTTLYGRHWGCLADFDSLHFEACYYQGIDYCIRQGLERFEPGAQGEHKIARGFLPTLTHSAHWLAHPAFSEAVADFLRRERPALRRYTQQLQQHSPYRIEV